MFGLRTKRIDRDRQFGLVFHWRLPLGSSVGFLTAIGVVALITAGLATTVRVRVGNVSRQPERRGTLILVPQGPEWKALEMMALEAGPMPRRADPSGDPMVLAMLEESLSAAIPPGYAYQPAFRPVAVEMPAESTPVAAKLSPGVLPPLPTPLPPSQNPPLPDPSRPLVLANGGIQAVSPDAMPPSGLARGNRYLLGYDASGRVIRVTTLFAVEPAVDDSAEQWLRQVVIEGGSPDGGWTAVEISSGP